MTPPTLPPAAPGNDAPRSPMKIGVVGCGALGSYYGGRLALSGHDVHFLLRSDYEGVRRDGVHVSSPLGDFHFRPQCARHPGEIGVCDWVIIGMKATANTAFEGLLRPLVGPHTAILTLQNGLGNEEALARIFPADQILGGLCFVCLNRTAPGRIHHLAHGRIMMGEFGRKADARTHHLAATLINAGVPCGVTDDLAKAHWEKLVWNIPFNGLGVASAAGYESVEAGRRLGTGPLQRCQGTDVMLSDPRYESRVRGLMREVIAVANALGLGVDPSWEQNQIDHTLCMGPYVASTLVDFERGLPLELDALFLEPLRVAKAAGVSVPLLERLCSLLAELDKARACHLPPTR